MKQSILSLTLALSAAAMLHPVAGLAHAFITDMEADAGSYHVVEIAVPHGCKGTATHTVRVKIPEGITLVRPEGKPGWQLSYTTRKSNEPYVTSEGARLTEVADEVTWSGGKLADSELGRFSLMVKLPDAPNSTLYFKTIQICEKGEDRWVEIARPGQSVGELKLPSPYLNLLPSKGWVLPFMTKQESKGK